MIHITGFGHIDEITLDFAKKAEIDNESPTADEPEIADVPTAEEETSVEK